MRPNVNCAASFWQHVVTVLAKLMQKNDFFFSTIINGIILGVMLSYLDIKRCIGLELGFLSSKLSVGFKLGISLGCKL